jgi:hypothetical protein
VLIADPAATPTSSASGRLPRAETHDRGCASRVRLLDLAVMGVAHVDRLPVAARDEPTAGADSSSGVEYPDAGAGDAGEPGCRLFGDEGLDVVPVPQPQPELGEQVEGAAAGEEAGADAVVEQGLAFEGRLRMRLSRVSTTRPACPMIGNQAVSAAQARTGQPRAR